MTTEEKTRFIAVFIDRGSSPLNPGYLSSTRIFRHENANDL